MEKEISKDWFSKNIRDFNDNDVISGYDENGLLYYNFYCDLYDHALIDLGIVKSEEELKEQLDNCEGWYLGYLYFFEDGRLSVAIEEPYDLGDNTIETFLTGEGATFIRELLEPYTKEE